MNALQMEELYESIDKAITGKDNVFIVFFGANKVSELGIKYLQNKGVRVSGIIDNGKDKEGTVRCGVEVFTPERLLSGYREDAVIFIASRYVKSMTEQLMSMGYEKNKHIFETIFHIPSISTEEFCDAAHKVKEGKKIYEDLDLKEDETLIICPYKGIGDIYFIGAYFKEYCKKECIGKYRFMVVGGACRRVAEMFGIEHILMVSQKEADRIIKYISFIGIYRFNVRIINHNYAHFNILSQFEIQGRISWGKMFLYGIMEFEDESLHRGLKPNVRKLDVSFYSELKKGRTVIFAPYANTVSNADTGMWEELAVKLKASGYEVLTNSVGDSEPVIKGTKIISAPLEDMEKIIEYAGVFIGIRSGICDLVAGAKAKKIILYPDRSSGFFMMEDMGIADDVTEICMYKQDNVVEYILGLLCVS